MQRDESKRLSAELYLAQERGRLFPEYFYTFLHSYMLIFSSTPPITSPDEKIERLVISHKCTLLQYLFCYVQ